MEFPILKTKLFIPACQQFVNRPRLTETFEKAISQKYRLILVSSGPGSGKTSLIADWVTRSSCSTAWFSLDEGDNDPIRFWHYFVTSLNQVLPEKTKRMEPNQQNRQLFLTSLLNQLTDLKHPLIIVLDDYHHISNPEIHQALDFWLTNAPPGITLLIATRSDPPFSLNKLRIRQQMSELREADLRFTRNEINQYLKERNHLSLPETDLITLEKRTEGWIAGLQMASLVLSTPSAEKNKAHSFIENFGSSRKFILDYLAEEVLLKQPQPIQEFLLKTSILTRLCAPLCEYVLESESNQNAQTTLTWLEQNNLFTQALDEQSVWFRYHQLFADLLQNQQSLRYTPEKIRGFHRRAAMWLVNHGEIEEAIFHAIRGEDYSSAVAWISQNAKRMMFDGRINTLKTWLTALPLNVFPDNPHLAIYQLWIDLLQGKKPINDQTIHEAETLLNTLSTGEENFSIQIELKVMLSRFIALAGNAEKAIRFAEDVLPYLAENDLASRARVNSALTIAYSFLGNIAKAQLFYQLCLRQAVESANFSLAAHTTYLIAFGQTMHGKLHLAKYFYESILNMGEKSGEEVFYPAGQAYIGLAGIYLEWNELHICQEYLKKGTDLCSQAGLDGLFQAKVLSARLYQAAGEGKKALEEITPLFKTNARENFSTLTARQIGIYLSMGNLDAATQAAVPLIHLLDDPNQTKNIPIHFIEVLKITLARVYLAQGDLIHAIHLLDNVLNTAKSANRNEHVLAASLAKALAADQQSGGNPSPTAEALINEALEIAEPEGYCLIFIEYGKRLLPYLRVISQKETMPLRLARHAQKILLAFNPTEERAASAKIPPPAEKLLETLTKREYQILSLIRDGKTNQEISEKLTLSPHTVKKHISNLYLKLGVNSRTQALNRAEELNLL